MGPWIVAGALYLGLAAVVRWRGPRVSLTDTAAALPQGPPPLGLPAVVEVPAPRTVTANDTGVRVAPDDGGPQAGRGLPPGGYLLG